MSNRSHSKVASCAAVADGSTNVPKVIPDKKIIEGNLRMGKHEINVGYVSN